jgi:hypothetical protein
LPTVTELCKGADSTSWCELWQPPWGQLGRTEEAGAALTEMEQLMPSDIQRDWNLTCPYADPAHEAHLLDGLRKTGWVEAVGR